MSSTKQPTRLAVLDDYTSTAPPHLNKLQEDTTLNLKIDYIPDTLNSRDPSQLQAQIDRLKPYQIISSMRERTAFPRELLTALPNLKFLLSTGLYCASVDLDAARELGITVVGSAGSRQGVTNEQTWALILGVTKRVAEDDRGVKTGKWQSGLNFGLAGKKLGLLGFGRLGVEAAVTGKLGFGMEVLAWSTSLTQEKADEAAGKHGLNKGTFKVAGSKEELFRESDVLSVHYVLSDRSRGIVGEKELRQMKKSAFLINTSRGPLIDEKALIEALKEERIGGAGLDVFDNEPLPADSAWRNTEWGSRVVLSPHTGYVEEQTMNGWYRDHAVNIRRWLNGEEVTPLLKVKGT